MSEFRHKTLSGIAWSTSSQVGRQILFFIIHVVLARLLSPKEFGLVAMVTVITGFAYILSGLGFGAALIQKKNVGQEHLSSVFWLNLVTGLLLMLMFMIGSSLISSFYNEPLLIPLTILISTNFLISSLSIVQRTLMTKFLNFRKLSVVEMAAVGLAGIMAITLAYLGFGVWSLAVQGVAYSVATTVLLWMLSDWRPALTFKWQAVKELLGFGLNLLGSQTLNYWTRNIDNLLVGRLLGSNPLGIYSRAYSVFLFPLTNISVTLVRVMFPFFSIMQEDKRRVKDMYLKMARTVGLLIFPMMCGLFVTTEPFVLAVFGPQWVEMIPILRVFCILGIIQSMPSLVGSLYLSQGRSDLQLRVASILRANEILGIVIGLKWGVIGVAIGYTTAALINLYPNIYFPTKLINLPVAELLSNLRGVFLSAAAMTAAVWGLGLWLPTGWPYWAYLATQVSFGAVIYFLIIYIFKLQVYLDLQTLAKEQWQLRRGRYGFPARDSGA